MLQLRRCTSAKIEFDEKTDYSACADRTDGAHRSQRRCGDDDTESRRGPSNIYNINLYQNGKWTQCNLHETSSYLIKGPFTHTEWSRGNTAFAYGNAIARHSVGGGDATVGVKLRLNKGELSWEDVQELPIAVKITMRYNLVTLQGPGP